MEDKIFYNKHYIRIREDGCIVDGFSDAFNQPDDADICINEKGGYQFRLYPDGEENPSLFDWNGIPRYRWDGSAAVLRTEEELEADRAARPAPPPTTNERISILEEQLAQSDETAITLYEAQEAQEAINSQQDEALMEIYEMIS